MKRRRVIIDSDAKNEADDQFAIVHALLTPMFDLRGLIAAHFGTQRTERSMEESHEEIDLLLELTELTGKVPVADGAPAAIPDEATPVDSSGARMIIDESMLATPEDPLYIAFLGPLTDMASAILLDPGLVGRPVAVIWIGGHPYDDIESYPGIEYNLSNDIAAANVVFDSGITVWQVPSNVYSAVSVGYAELEEKLGDAGRLGRYLVDQLVDYNTRWFPLPIEHRSLGDSPAVALMMNPMGGSFRVQPSPRFGPDGAYLPGAGNPIRVCESIDERYLLEDMFAKIRRFARQQG